MSSTETLAWKKTESSTENFSTEPRVGCVIMASGLGKRFGGNKLMADFNGKPVIQWGIDTAKEVFDRLVVVTRSSEVKALCQSLLVDCLLHGEPGRNDTVRIGLSHLLPDIDYCLFLPGDQPLLSKESLLAFKEQVKCGETYIYRAGFCDRVGAPICFPKAVFSELLKLPEGKGGGVVAKAHPERLRVIPVKDEKELDDIDTKEDLDRLRQMT